MNFLAFGLILICCHVWATEIDDNFLVRRVYAHKTRLEKAIEKCKFTLQHGDSENGIPILDPYTTPKLVFKYNESDIDLDAVFTNFTVTGLSSYKVNSFTYRLIGLKVHLDLTWPLIIVNATHYTISNTSKVFGYDIYGDGEMNGTVYNYAFVTDISFVLKGKYIQVKTMTSKLSLQELDFSATGLFYQDNETSAETSKKISEMAPEVIDQKQEMIANDVSQMITEYLNKYLSTITFKDLLKLLRNLLRGLQ